MRADGVTRGDGGDITGQVTDSSSGQSLASAEVSVMRGTNIVVNTTTDAFGRYTAHNVAAGSYTVVARFIGFRRASKSVTVDANVNARVDFALAPIATALAAQEIRATVPLAVDTRTGNQRFKEDSYHGTPTNTTSQIVQQGVAGAARAPTGEVHIRGQHAEYTYVVDGVPVPAGISGSLNELFDPSIVNQIDFITGGWDAEYGNKNAAIVDVTTRIPSGGLHMNTSAFGGSYNTNGQSVSATANSGTLGYFFSGTRQSTDMRREPVVFDPATRSIVNFHNHGDDLFGFGKVQYAPSNNDIVNLTANVSRTRFEVPFDSTGGLVLDDRQQDVNTFVNLGYRHSFGDAGLGAAGGEGSAGDELFAGLFYRYGTLRYTPGASDDPAFTFFPDTTPYNLRERRNFNTVGVKLDYTVRPARELEFKFGTVSSLTQGHEDFNTVSRLGNAGPASNSALRGHDIGVYAQTSYAPIERFEIRTGVRFDSHVAPFAATQSQVSPRIRLNFYLNTSNTVYLYYGRQFIPTNVEDLRSITSVAQGDTATVPTLPERDNFYEAGYIHRFPFGVVSKLTAFHKQSSPGIDDNTVPGSAIVTSVNIADVRVTGLEGVLEVRPRGPFAGYVNFAVSHAYGRGPITGGFFPEDTPAGYFDLDHDQRYSGVANLTYAQRGFYASATGTYGSGLTNGADPDSSYSTGLFAMNRSIKVPPNFIGALATGYSFTVGRAVARPELFIDNVFNKKYLLKGQFFSGPSVGRPRTFQVRMNLNV